VISPIDRIAELFAGEGVRSYLGEDVSIAVHMLQAGALAERAGAADALVAAALLHDVGHFEAIGRRLTDAQELEAIDFRHQDSGADWLAQWFPTEVTEPVRLHVMAKRYLCAVEAGYLAQLSPASVHTLSLQGGPLTVAEVQKFESLPHAQAAVSVRRWDDQAKDPRVATPPFDHFRQLLRSCLAAHSADK
jgi:gamma-butyrobetaine dioxygenase